MLFKEFVFKQNSSFVKLTLGFVIGRACVSSVFNFYFRGAGSVGPHKRRGKLGDWLWLECSSSGQRGAAVLCPLQVGYTRTNVPS